MAGRNRIVGEPAERGVINTRINNTQGARESIAPLLESLHCQIAEQERVVMSGDDEKSHAEWHDLANGDRSPPPWP